MLFVVEQVSYGNGNDMNCTVATMGQDLTILATDSIACYLPRSDGSESKTICRAIHLSDLAIATDIIPVHCQDLELTQRNSKINFLVSNSHQINCLLFQTRQHLITFKFQSFQNQSLMYH